jgi:Flp pilus assembly protein TadG
MRHRFRGENGTVLMLMPVAVLIMFVLGAITVDLTAVRAGQQDLLAAATDAAYDAATAGLDEAALRSGRGYQLDPTRAWLVAVDALATKGLLDNLSTGPDVTINFDGSVTVALTRRIPHLFARALPGAPDDELERATATATVQQR